MFVFRRPFERCLRSIASELMLELGLTLGVGGRDGTSFIALLPDGGGNYRLSRSSLSLPVLFLDYLFHLDFLLSNSAFWVRELF